MIKVFQKQSQKVFVALSGGVDSSTSSALLKEQGYDVTGVFIRVWQPDFLECNWREDRRDAMRVCAHLNIPFLEFNFEEEYKKEVADYMINEYKIGRTPNPDIMCNQQIKFGAFLDKALSIGADYIATGHYARLQPENLSSKSQVLKLLIGADKNKDQSYFLWTLGQDKLKYVLFPIGEYQKSKVRELAKKFSLPTFEKKDSQGICFIGKLDMKTFLKNYIDEKRGNVLNEEGKIIGWHNGTLFFTLGERHGFTITEKGTDDKPYYIIAKDIEKNALIVSHFINFKEKDKLRIKIDNTNWISGKEPDIKNKYKVRYRYRQELQDCKITSIKENSATIEFMEDQITASSGQSLVLYLDEEVIGGGIII